MKSYWRFLSIEVIGFTLAARIVYGKAGTLSGRPVESYHPTQRRGHRTFRSVGADALRSDSGNNLKGKTTGFCLIS